MKPEKDFLAASLTLNDYFLPYILIMNYGVALKEIAFIKDHFGKLSKC